MQLSLISLLSLLMLASAQICLNTNWKVNGGRTGNLQCTQGATILSAEVVGVPETCDSGSIHTATLKVTIATPSADRYDIGYYLDLNGGDAFDGYDCYSGYLNPIVAPGQLASPISGVGPYSNLDGDSCGDLSKHHPSVITTTEEIEFLCQDTDADEKVNLKYCFSWKLNSGNIACSSHLQAYPAQVSQCACGELNVDNLQVVEPPFGIASTCIFGDVINIAASETMYALDASTAVSNYLALLPDRACAGTSATFSFGEWTHVRVFYIDLHSFNDQGSLYLVNTCGWQSETKMLAYQVPASDSITCIPEILDFENFDVKCSVPFEPCLNNSWVLDLDTAGSGKYVVWLFSKSAELSPGDEFSITRFW
eukprot:TRINITY_DN5216_c0_g1_i1.p1 TRINITY_DN5216_c0_g1~~TRINITY_DN5216_c0_g1_i1.p1  ORF type:complete len:367 (-),score=81.66 TRINITY_DN5216_c0_g1_i1:118-1218(-)